MDDLIAAQIQQLQRRGLYRTRAVPFVGTADGILTANDFLASRREIKRAECTGLYTSTRDELQQRQKFSREEYINFCSNDYLSLGTEPKLKQAYQEGFGLYPCGSGGSAVISGYHASHQQLEARLAAALGADDAILFSSGYAANLALMTLLASFNAHSLIDKSMHASIYDGLKLAQAQYSRYRHCDCGSLETQLKRDATNAVVLTEGLFSMSGQMAPLDAIIALCRQYKAPCIVDEAHSFGLLGPQGLGLVKSCSLSQDEVPLRLIAFGKALAGQGAVVVGKKQWIDALLQQGRSYIYSTALSPALAHGMMTAFDLMIAADDRRLKLDGLVRYFQQKCENSHLNWRKSVSPIQQLQLGCPHLAKKLADYLMTQGIFCQAIRQPTVTLRETGLRIVLNYNHHQEDIDRLFIALDQSDYFLDDEVERRSS